MTLCGYCRMPEAIHLGYDHGKNRLDNLAWGTPAENHADRKRNGINLGGGHVLTADQAREVRALAEEGKVPQKKIGERFGITQSAVSFILTRRTWSDLI